MTTWDKIAAALRPYGLKQVGREEWRSNRPWSASAKPDSMGLSIKVLPDGEYGMFKDHVEDEGGSLYELAKRLNVELPERAAATPTKRGYTGLADYAEAHGAPVEAFDGWIETRCNNRPALQFKVNGQDRYRFIDGAPGKEPFWWAKGSHPALYGWARAVDMARKAGRKVVYVNGAATVRVAQWYGIPAFTVEGGEHAIPDPIIEQLVAEWDGEFLFALDSDYTGQKAMYGSVAKLAAKGRKAYNADLLLVDRGDLCDFRRLYGDDTYAELERRARVPAATDEPMPSLGEVAQQAAALEKAVKAAQTDPMEAAAKQAAKLGAQMERITTALAPPRIRELHELATETLSPQTERRWATLPIPELAALVGPLEPELYVLLGATGMGKSWFAASMAASLTMKYGPGLVVTTEMRPISFFQRMTSYAAHVSGLRVKEGQASAQERSAWETAAGKFKGYEGWVLDMSSPTPQQVEVAAKQARSKVGLTWLVVDSASRMAGPDGVYERMTGIANSLQNMAREFDIPVIATSQIGRDVTGRAEGKRAPRLDDGYGSGAIEHNAGVVIGLYNHAYYVRKELEPADDMKYPPNTARLELLKNRNRAEPDQPWCTVSYEAGCGLYQYRTQTVNIAALAEGRTA